MKINLEVVISKNDVHIRLMEERWIHIVETHDDLAGYYEDVLVGITILEASKRK